MLYTMLKFEVLATVGDLPSVTDMLQELIEQSK